MIASLLPFRSSMLAVAPLHLNSRKPRPHMKRGWKRRTGKKYLFLELYQSSGLLVQCSLGLLQRTLGMFQPFAEALRLLSAGMLPHLNMVTKAREEVVESIGFG